MYKFDKEKIKQLRNNTELTQYEFGKRLGTSRQRIHAWEEGITRPNVGALEMLCEIFNVHPGYFFDEI